MAQITISTIQNKALRKAAETADSNGKNAHNGKIDTNELNLFLNEAQKADCKMIDVMEIVNKVGVQKDDKTTLAKVNKLKEVDALESKIAVCEQTLKKMKYEHSLMGPKVKIANSRKFDEAAGILCVTGFFGSIAAGMKLGATVGSCIGGLGGAVAGAFVGGLCGVVAFGNVGMCCAKFMQQKELEYRNDQKNADDYEKTNIKPMEDKLKQLKKQLEIKENEFYTL